MQQLRCSRSSATLPAHNTAKHRAKTNRGGGVELFIDRFRPGGMVISLQVNDNQCANFWSRSSVCCCNSLLLTQRRTRRFTHTLSPGGTRTRILPWKLHYLTERSAWLPLIVRVNRFSDLVGLRCSQKRRRSAAEAIAVQLYSPTSRVLLWISAPRLLAGLVVRLNAWSTQEKQQSNLVFK